MTEVATKANDDERWCENGEDRYGEYGVIGAEQADESHLDDRFGEKDGDENDDFGADGRIHFATQKLYGRDEELKQLKQLFERNQASAVFVSGYSGSGKSRVVEEFIKQNSIIQDRKPSIIFLRSKSEAMQASVPFSSITGLFDNIDKSISDEFVDMREEIQEVLGSDARLLLKVFPKLEKYLGKDGTDRSSLNTGSSHSKSDSFSISSNPDIFGSAKKQDTKKRMMLALQVFFRTLAARSKRRLCMFWDDLQWIDSLSVELMESLLTDNLLQNLFFFGGYRSNEVQDGHMLMQKIQDIKEKRTGNQMKGFLGIELEDLHKEAIGQFIADSLRLDYEEVLPLTNAVFTKTLGNPFFTRQALEYLVLKNALYYDNISFRWNWKLQEKELQDLISDDLLEMIKVKIEHMEPQLQEVLMTASCTRSTFDVETILVLLHPQFLKQKEILLGATEDEEKYEEEKLRLIELLDQAVLAGLLVQPKVVKRTSSLRYSVQVSSSGEVLGDEYAFAHDKIQETSRNLKSSTANEFEFLERIGNVLSKRAEDPVYGEDWMYFTACEHLNRVSTHYKTLPESAKQEEKKPELMGEEKQFRLAALNLRTAQLSIDLLSFPAALDFCEHGIAYLPAREDERWSKKYHDTTLHLYSIAAQAKYGVADLQEAERYCNLVIDQHSGTNSKVTTMEAMSVYLIYLDILGARDNPAALELCLKLLKSEYSMSTPKAKWMLRAKSWWSLRQVKSRYLPTEESIQDMPQVTDPLVANKMELLKRASTMSFADEQIQLYILLNCKSVKQISQHGLTESSAASIASFANALMHVYNDFKTSPKLAELAIFIADRQKSKFSETHPLNTANNNILGWVRPIASRIKYHERAYNSGIASGNITGAYMGKYYSLEQKLFSCTITLPELEGEFRVGVTETRKAGQQFMGIVSAVVWQLTLNLIGKSGNPNTTVLTGEAIDESTDLYQKQMPFRMIFGPWKSFVLLFFGDYEGGAEDALKRGEEFPKLALGMMFGFESVLRALPLLIMARSDNSQKAKYRKSAMAPLERVRRLVKNGCVNLVGPHQLVEAEYMSLQKKDKAARSFFEMAIARCRKDHFHHFAGLACELYAAYLSEVGDSEGEKIYLESAIGNYRRWGFVRKVDILKRKLSD